MLNVTELIGFGAGEGRKNAPWVSRREAFYSAGDSNYYSYAVSYGWPESATRRIIVAYSTAGPYDASACVIGGVSATKLGSSGGWYGYTGFYTAVVPTGASGTLGISFTGVNTGCIMYAWALDNAIAGYQFLGGAGTINAPNQYPSVAFCSGLAGSGMSFTGSVTSINGVVTSVSTVYGPAQESTAYWHTMADLLPPDWSGSFTVGSTVSPVDMSTLVFW